MQINVFCMPLVKRWLTAILFDVFFVFPYIEIQILLIKPPVLWPGMGRNSNPESDRMN